MDLTKFFIFLLGLALTSVAASSIGFAVSARVKVAAMANLFVALIYVLSMVRVYYDNPCVFQLA